VLEVYKFRSLAESIRIGQYQKGYVNQCPFGCISQVFPTAVKLLSRVNEHPILEVEDLEEVEFTWNGTDLKGRKGEVISSALIANDIHVFGHHPKDGSPQGIFCANGQCAQCLVMVDEAPVKSCMTPLQEGMEVRSVEGLPELPETGPVSDEGEIETVEARAHTLKSSSANVWAKELSARFADVENAARADASETITAALAPLRTEFDAVVRYLRDARAAS
jgi:hypothetical protein